MIHPSYVEMIDNINSKNNGDREEAPLVTSRYSVVLATAKRARQIIAGAEPKIPAYDRYGKKIKPLSLAVEEMYEGKVNFVRSDESEEEESAE